MSEEIKLVSFYPGYSWRTNDDKISTIPKKTSTPAKPHHKSVASRVIPDSSERIKHVSFNPGNHFVCDDGNTSTISERTPTPAKPSVRSTGLKFNSKKKNVELKERDFPHQSTLTSFCEFKVSSQNVKQKSSIDGNYIKLVIDKNQNESFSKQLKKLEEILQELACSCGIEKLLEELRNIFDKNLPKNQSENPVKKMTELSHYNNKFENMMTTLNNRIRYNNTIGNFSHKICDKINLHDNTKTISDVILERLNNKKRNNEKIVIKEPRKAGMLKINADKMNLSDSPKNKSVGKIVEIVELAEILNKLISVCEKIVYTLQIMDQYQLSNDYDKMAKFYISKLIHLKCPLSASLIIKYDSAELFHKFMTGFYIMYFSNCLVIESKVSHLRIDVVYQQERLKVWLKKYIPMLNLFKNSVADFPKTWDLKAWDEWLGIFQVL